MTDIAALAVDHNRPTGPQVRSRGVKETPLRPAVLWPYSALEAITVPEAVVIARRSKRTVREWCARFDIGRRIAGGQWMVSRAALQMLLDGDKAALAAYLAGDRSSLKITEYFQRCGVPLPRHRGPYDDQENRFRDRHLSEVK